jgi:tetratricopeptide (TPR) repeat protein
MSCATSTVSSEKESVRQAGIEAFKERNYSEARRLLSNEEYSEAIRKLSMEISEGEGRYKSKDNEFNLGLLYLDRGRAYLTMGKPELAREDFSNAIKNGWPEAVGWVYISTIPPETYQIYSNGLDAYNNKDYDLAIQEFTEAIQLTPDFANAYLQRGKAYRKKSLYQDAINDLYRISLLNPEEYPYTVIVQANYEAAEIFEIFGNARANNNRIDGTDGAIDYYNRALPYYRRVTSLHKYDGEFISRYTIYAYAQFRIKYLEAFLLGLAASDKKDYDTAIAQYIKVLALDEDHTAAKNSLKAAWFELANASRDKKDYDAAIAQYRNVLELDKDHAGAKDNLKAVWDERIAANQNLYPAPFEGTWQFHLSGSYTPGTPSRTETYTQSTWQPSAGATYRRSDGSYGTTGGSVSSTHTRTIPGTPGTSTPELRIVYEFNGKNYTMTGTAGSKSGTFYYSGNTIELDDGRVLKLSEDKKSLLLFTKQ